MTGTLCKNPWPTLPTGEGACQYPSPVFACFFPVEAFSLHVSGHQTCWAGFCA